MHIQEYDNLANAIQKKEYPQNAILVLLFNWTGKTFKESEIESVLFEKTGDIQFSEAVQILYAHFYRGNPIFEEIFLTEIEKAKNRQQKRRLPLFRQTSF